MDEAVRLFETPRAAIDPIGLRVLSAWSYVLAVEAFLERNGRGDTERAHELIQEGRTLAEDIGMPPLIERFEKLE